MNTKITTTLLTIASIATVSPACASTEPGWGSKQTQRTIQGILSGATVGGIIGHQHDKQKEGIIIGSVLGGLIGNRSGANKDYRNAQQEQKAWEARKEAMRRQEYLRQKQLRERKSVYRPVSINPTSGSLHNDPEIVAAKQRVEQLELELQRQQQARERELQKQRLLREYAEREARASKELNRAPY